MSYASTSIWLAVSSLTLVTQGAWAALQTTPFLAIHSQPKYSQLSAMPYANVYAAKEVILTTSVYRWF